MRIALPVLLLSACSSRPADDDVGTSREPIVDGTPATNYPEAVVVTASGFLPCSGAVLAPRVVLTAGHCRSLTNSYEIVAPNAGNQQSTASSDWTSYNGDPATSSDTLLIFLDSPIVLSTYPQIGDEPVAQGTAVVDIGRTLNGSITSTDYVSPTVTIEGPATSLGFPFNYEALPDISQDGDSGGPIEVEDFWPMVRRLISSWASSTPTRLSRTSTRRSPSICSRVSTSCTAPSRARLPPMAASRATRAGAPRRARTRGLHTLGGCAVGIGRPAQASVFGAAIPFAALALRRRRRQS